MQHSTSVGTVAVLRNSKRIAVQVPIPERFEGTNADARTLRQQCLEEVQRALDDGLKAYGRAIEFVKSRFNAVTTSELINATVSHGERSVKEDRDMVVFYVPAPTRVFKGKKGDDQTIVAELKRRLLARIGEYWNVYVNEIA